MAVELTEFTQKVLAAVNRIPRGRVTTYGELARFLGRPGGARVVGQALKKNPWLGKVPCHRVVRADGSLGGYVVGLKRKKTLLAREGIKIRNNKIVNFKKLLFRFCSS